MSQTIEFTLPDGVVVLIDQRVASTTVPARPGLFVIELVPLPGGGFDPIRVLKTPVVAWQVKAGGWASPIVSGAKVKDRWAVLLPDGFVVLDAFSCVGLDKALCLSDWNSEEVRWMKFAPLDVGERTLEEFSTPREAIFRSGSPTAKAITAMMSLRTEDWVGNPDELQSALSAFRVYGDPPLSADPAVFSQSNAMLANVGIVAERLDDGRIRISRRGGQERSFSIGSVAGNDNSG